ncbi:unnamed protein product [Brugia timori]|uniref:Uncharacterized protein n=1 Tax=Brugia timori TaxID=42155 RepID=A0A0R3QWB3_9BILA|nr:unnamed protein product [Brugia timori]
MKAEGAGAVQDFGILELVKLKSNDLNGWCCDSISVQRTHGFIIYFLVFPNPTLSIYCAYLFQIFSKNITDTGEGHQFACSISNQIKACNSFSDHF